MKKKSDNNHEHELRLDGVNGFVSSLKNGGKEIRVTGWTRHGLWQVGDRILLTLEKEGDRETRYQITEIERPGDPPDMYFMNLSFLPRTAPGKKVRRKP